MKTILITWISSWLWYSLATHLDALERTIIGIDKRPLPDIHDHKNNPIDFVLLDITESEKIPSVLTAIMSKYEHIDVLINNAGIWTDDSLDKTYPKNQEEVFRTNALGNMYITEYMAWQFKEQKSWHIINIVSSAALDDHPAGNNQSWKFYGASKRAFNGYIHALKKDLENTAIKISCIYPGWFESNLYEHAKRKEAHHQPRMMDTEEVTKAVLFVLNTPIDVCIDHITITKHFTS